MAKKMLVRVDDRLIHGQVLTQWVGEINAQKIVVIDDEVSQDKMRKNILKFACPSDIKMAVYSAEKAAEVWAKNKFGAYNVMVLFRDVNMIKKCKDLGLVFDEVSLGQMSITDGREQIHRTFGLSEQEAKTLLDLERDGMTIYFRMTPMDSKENLDVICAKFPSLSRAA